MNILISNDDGIRANGIKILSQELSKKHNVYIIAPDRERSATSHSLTIHSPLRVEEIESSKYGAKRTLITSGTPADCVKMGLCAILSPEEKPDIVISGINHGPNLGHDVQYSGTVSAAKEASMLSIPAIAASIAAIDITTKDFEYPAKYIADLIENHNIFNSQILLNINFPNIKKEDIKGVEITQLAGRIFTSEYEKRTDPQGKNYYWLAGIPAHDTQDKLTDLYAIRNNKISITPICYDMTNYKIIPQLNDLFSKQPV